MRTTALGAAIAAFVLAGCSWKEVGRSTVGTDYQYGAPSLVSTEVSGTGEVLADGTVRVDLQVVGRCDRPATAINTIEIREQRSHQAGRRHSLGAHVGLASSGAGAALMLSGTDTAGGALIGGGAILLGYSAWALARGGKTDRRERRITERGESSRRPADCPAALTANLDSKLPDEIALTTPWGETVVSRIEGPRVAFAIDWTRAKVDPTLPGAGASLEGLEWKAEARGGSGRFAWKSTDSDAAAMLAAIAAARDIDWSVSSGGPPPRLRATATIGGGGAIHYDSQVPVELTVSNQGPGDAYRVVARTKSGRPELSKLRLVFGRIKPGETKTRRTTVELPRSSLGTREVILFELEEANGHRAPELTEAIEIKPANRPYLSVDCRLAGPVRVESGAAVIDAGERFKVACEVTNRGKAAAKKPELSARLGTGSPVSARGRDIDPGQRTRLEVELQVPADAQLDTSLWIYAKVGETNFGLQVNRTLYAKVGKPQLCPKKLTLAEYNQEKRKYEGLLRAGDITREEFDAYHAELVRCLE